MKTSHTFADIAFCIALAALALIPFAASAGSGPTGFTENKGQIHDQFRKPNPAVLYLLNGPGMNVQLRKDGFAYDTYMVTGGENPRGSEIVGEVMGEMEAMTAEPTVFDFHRIDISFVNGDPNAEIIVDGRSEDYTNYYTDVTGEAGATYVHSYSTITYRNVWPSIDVRFNSGEDGFKYDVIVRPGGDLHNVRFEVKGARASENLKGELVFTWVDGTLKELIPASWVENGRKREHVRAVFTVHSDGTYGFQVLAPSGTLVIDPAIQWATYYGGTGNESKASAAMDDVGNAYIAGETWSTSNIATSGTHDATFNGGTDAYIAKLSPAGLRIWGTYAGGPSSDLTNSIQVNGAGLAVITGYTFSTTGIATAGAHKTVLTGSTDAFLMLFNANGTRQWGTYYGGSVVDQGNDASIALNGRVALVGQTNSTTGIATAGAPDVTFGGGLDGFVAWFSPTGARLFGSYIGGTGDDWASGVAAGFANSEFVVSGTTMSASGIATAGSHDATYNGLHDAFMALYNGSGTGTKTWCTYYGGTGYDFGMAVTWLSSNTFVMCGKASSTTGIATAGSDQSVYGGGTTDGFHVAFDRFTKARLYGSYIGGSDEDQMQRIAKLGNQGYAIATPHMSAGLATAGSFGPVGPGPYVAGYTSSGVKNWAGYMPDHDFFSIGLGANSTSAVVVGGNELGDATTTPGTHQTTSGGGWDLIIHRLSNTAPPLLMPLVNGPERIAAQYKMVIGDHALSVLPIDHEPNTQMLLRLVDATGRLLSERLWNGSAQADFAGLNSGAYVLVSQSDGGAPTSTRFVIP